jgi:serine/threonine-protein kinase
VIGKTLGKYRIVEQIGRGGMAEVYKAYHPGLDRYVAIKLMHTFLADEEGFLERFQREARSVARLRHPNIVQMYDFDAEENVYYMVMEYLQGPSLKNHLAALEAQDQWLSLEEALRIVRDVGQALEYAHRHEMFHRDVKPANIMMTASGGAILTDFGIVKMLGAATQLTASGAMVGTPAYMAPEQSMGASGDARADVYSLGIVLYQLVTGRLPYDADTPMAVVLKHISAPLPIPSTLNPDLPEGIERVILKALAKDPDDRYQSVHDMLEHLDLAMMGVSIPEVDPSITSAAQPIAGVPTLTGDDLATPVPAARTRVAAPAAPPAARRPAWWVFGLIGLAIVAAIILTSSALGGRDEKATPTASATPKPTTTVVPPTETVTPTSTPTPTRTPDMTATSFVATRDAFELTANAPTSTPTSTPTPTPTLTPTPTVTPTPTPACVYDATLEKHVTYDWTPVFAPNTSFRKTWQLRNSGDCAWPPGTVLAFVSGDLMGAEETIEIESLLAPDETADFSIDLRAPRANGSYAATWRLQGDNDEFFGDELTVEISVGPTPTPRPTSPPPPTATPLVSPTPLGPLEMNNYADIPHCFVNYDNGTWTATITWQVRGGTGVYEYYYDGATYERLAGPSYDINGQVNQNWIGTFCTHSGAEVVCQPFIIQFDTLWCK